MHILFFERACTLMIREIEFAHLASSLLGTGHKDSLGNKGVTKKINKKNVLGTCRKISGLKATGHASTCMLAACGLPPSACAIHTCTHTHSLTHSLSLTHIYCISAALYIHSLSLSLSLSPTFIGLVRLFTCIRRSLCMHEYVSFSRSLCMH
jgi:hypothetical protein